MGDEHESEPALGSSSAQTVTAAGACIIDGHGEEGCCANIRDGSSGDGGKKGFELRTYSVSSFDISRH